MGYWHPHPHTLSRWALKAKKKKNIGIFKTKSYLKKMKLEMPHNPYHCRGLWFWRFVNFFYLLVKISDKYAHPFKNNTEACMAKHYTDSYPYHWAPQSRILIAHPQMGEGIIVYLQLVFFSISNFNTALYINYSMF